MDNYLMQAEPSTDPGQDQYINLKNTNLIEKSAVFLIYLLIALFVLCKVGKHLNLTAFVTIFLFISAEAMNLGFYLMELYSSITDDN